MQITICGGGNAAHTATGLLSAREEHQEDRPGREDDAAWVLRFPRAHLHDRNSGDDGQLAAAA